MLTIEDERGFLPKELYQLDDYAGKEGLLYVPEDRYPIHIESVKRVLQSGKNRAVFWPRSQHLYESDFPNLKPAFFFSTQDQLPHLKKMIEEQKRKREERHKSETNVKDVLEVDGFECISQVTQEETEFYYVSNHPYNQPYPSQVSVTVGNQCNLSCIMCPYHGKQHKTRQETDYFNKKVVMSKDLMNKIAIECGAMKSNVKIGNIEEPFLNPFLCDFIEQCDNYGAPSKHITTNGTLLTEQLSERLLKAGLNSLYVSIDANRPETYQKIRGGQLAQVEKNIMNFLEKREKFLKGNQKCSVMVSLIKNKSVTKDEIEEFKTHWGELCDGVIIYNLAEWVDGHGVALEIEDDIREKIQNKQRLTCLNPFKEVYIAPDGNVSFCCDSVAALMTKHSVSMGNMNVQTIKEIWDNEAFTKLRRALLYNQLDEWPLCKTCSIWMSNIGASERTDRYYISKNMMTTVIKKI